MLFRRNIPHSCSLCIHGAKLDEDHILCTKKGLRSADSKCIRYRYDPCKRMPRKQKAMDFSKYDEEDFTL